jgi:hypothetical protein
MSTTTSTKSQRINPVSIGMAFLIFAVICLLIGGFFDYQISKNVAGLDEHK